MELKLDFSRVPSPVRNYIAWVDVMGSQGSLLRWPKVAANFILKLHISALQHRDGSVVVYPVIDGFYATSSRRQDLVTFLRLVFRDLAETFAGEKYDRFRFLARGAMSYGQVYHGSALDCVNYNLGRNKSYIQQVLVGAPMAVVAQAEKTAPPLGLVVEQEAAKGALDGLSGQGGSAQEWRWLDPKDEPLRQGILAAADSYYEWCREERRKDKSPYTLKKIDEHHRQLRQYFAKP